MFVFLPLMYFWCRDPMYYPSRIRSSILCMFLLTVVVPNYDHSTLSTRTSVTAGESDWEANSLDSMTAPGLAAFADARSTRIGSTMGKFYRNGRRWVFEYALPSESQADLTSTSSQQNLKEVREVVTTTTDRLTNSITTVTTSSTATATSSSAVDPKRPVLLRPLSPRSCVFECWRFWRFNAL